MIAHRLLAALLAALVAVPLSSRPLIAQEAAEKPAPAAGGHESDHRPKPGESPLDAYRLNAMEVRSSFWNGLQVYQGGRALDLGFLGGNYDTVFAGYPEALDPASTYHTMKVTGFSLWAVGTATLLATLVLLIADKDLLIETDRTGLVEEQTITPLFWGLLGGGVAVGITGGVLMQSADSYLSDAVGIYNDSLYEFLREMAPHHEQARALQLRYRGSF